MLEDLLRAGEDLVDRLAVFGETGVWGGKAIREWRRLVADIQREGVLPL